MVYRKKKEHDNVMFFLAMSPHGLEPWTQGLKVPCSTN